MNLTAVINTVIFNVFNVCIYLLDMMYVYEAYDYCAVMVFANKSKLLDISNILIHSFISYAEAALT